MKKATPLNPFAPLTPLAALTLALMLALLAACAPVSKPAPVYDLSSNTEETEEAPAQPPQEYEVAKGDTLILIAMHYDLDYRDLAFWNNLSDPDLIQPGQRLRLTPPPNAPVVNTVPRQNAPKLQSVPNAVDAAEAAPSAAPAPATSATGDAASSAASAAGEVASAAGTAAAASNGASAAALAAPAIAVATEAAAAAANAVSAAGSDASPDAVKRETTVIGEQRPASPAPAPGTAPYKTGPQAIKYAYSNRLLKKLRAEWRTQQAAAQSAAQAATQAAAAQAAAAPAAPAVSAPNAPAAVQNASLSASQKARQKYGVTWGLPTQSAVIKKYSKQRKGVAFGGERGTPVYAAADGEVIYVGTGVKSYGRLVILRHSNNYLSAYAHNEEILVQEGQRVTRGSQIANMGDSGSERVMLHFEVRKEGKPVDPALVLPQ